MISTNLASALLWSFPSIVFLFIMSSISIIFLRLFLENSLFEIGIKNILLGGLYLLIFMLILIAFHASDLYDGVAIFSVLTYVCIFLVATYLAPIAVILKFFSKAKIHWFVVSAVVIALLFALISEINSVSGPYNGFTRWYRGLPVLIFYLVPSAVVFAWGAKLRF